MNRSAPAVSAEVALQTIADPRRRKVLQYLVENGTEPVSMDRLVAVLADGDSSADAVQSNSSDPAVTELYHVHLPKLDEAGFVEVDREDATVCYHQHDGVEDLLQYVAESF